MAHKYCQAGDAKNRATICEIWVGKNRENADGAIVVET